MAHRVEVTKLLAGPKHWILHVYIESDGASGDLDSYVLINPDDEDLDGATKFTIENITWGFDGFSTRLHFELLTLDNLIWVLPDSSCSYVEFNNTQGAGLTDRGQPVDNPSGRLLLTTRGLSDAGDAGSFIIKLRRG